MLITPPAMLSYPALLTPRLGPNPKPGDLPTYGCTLVFPKDADLTELKNAATAALKERFGDKLQSLLKNGSLRIPFRPVGDKYDEDTYGYFINVSAKTTKPGLVDRYAGPDGKPAPLTDVDKLYPGCMVKAAVSVYSYDNSGNKGVSFGLQHIQWWAEGTRLDNRKAAADAFAAEALPEASLAAMGGSSKADSLSDLLGG